MFKITKQNEQQLEDIKEDQCSHKLDPSLLLLSSNSSSSSSKELLNNKADNNNLGTMVLRKRQNGKPMLNHHKSGYITEMEAISKQQQATKTNSGQDKIASGRRQERVEEKIFSVTTSVVLCMTLVTLIGAICLANCNRAMLVSAQFSSPAVTAPNQQQQQQQQQQVNQQPSQQPPAQQQQVAPQMIMVQQPQPAPGSRPQITNHRPNPTQAQQAQQQQKQQQSALPVPKSTQSSQVVMAATTTTTTEEPQATKSQMSIDRFDSGEQIRPPLVKQPTTLAPLTQSGSSNNNKPQQISAVHMGQINLQTAASQGESYLSPDDREQLIKRQESHYEGKQQGDGGAQSESASNGDGYDQPASLPNGRLNGSGEEGASEQEAGGAAHLKGSESRYGGPGAAGSEADDGDYEDDGAADAPDELNQRQGTRSSAVPENRRMAGGEVASQRGDHGDGDSYHGPRQRVSTMNNHDSSMRARQVGPAIDAAGGANDESDPNGDEYSGANDDSYFGRKSSTQQGELPGANQLNLAASHNQQNRKQSSQGNIRGYSSDNENREPADDSPGFGPGPNEAYMVDRAELSAGGRGKPSVGLDNEDDGSYSGPGGDSDSGSEEGGGKFDRRSMGGDATASGGGRRATEVARGDRPYVSPLNYDDNSLGVQDNPFENSGIDHEDDADDGSESNEDVAPALAPSSKEESKLSSHRPSLGLESRFSNAMPGRGSSGSTSASASTPQATTNPSEPQLRPIPAALPVAPPSSLQAAGLTNNNNIKLPQGQQQTMVAAMPTVVTIPARLAAFHHRQPIFGQQQHLQQQQQLHYPMQQPPLNLFNLHKHSMGAPYNPQNNPSHAGKYFIN